MAKVYRRYRIWFILLCSNICCAEPLFTNQQDFTQDIGKAGISYLLNDPNNMDITIDLVKSLTAIPAMQIAGVVNPKLNLNDINMLPVSLSVSVVGMFYTSGILQHVFAQNPNLQQLHVRGYLMGNNNYGIETRQECFGFDFNRELYEKINWDSFVTANLISISPNFAFTDWCRGLISKETNLAV